ncbi:MAG TPA: serine/threonine-protein kinase, partial [Candidatus Nanopelagicales bacterium]|nr:serine/threonine-protein kinase [Candidatus Nanopelagicales bacterium]
MAPPRDSMEILPPAEVAQERPPGARDPYIGTTFDHRYKIDRLLGEGGMGFVYLARHKVIDKKVAVKVLRAELAKDEEIFERFVQEARAASSIGNPHIVDVSDFGDLPDGSKYFVMEYLEGVSLSSIIDGPNEIPHDLIYKIGLQMSDGLSAAHDGGIVHRDLKPDNVYVVHRGNDPEFVKILDFGIAKVTTESDSKLTQAGAVFGTPHYMSPEQAAGAPIDHRTDIYSMGVMLYELVSRQLPFTSENFMGILTQHMYKAPVPPRALVGGPGPQCPPSLEAIILKCLSKKPEARYQTMSELREDLTTARSGSVPKAVPEMMSRSGGFNVPQDYFKPKPPPPTTNPPPSPSNSRGVP